MLTSPSGKDLQQTISAIKKTHIAYGFIWKKLTL